MQHQTISRPISLVSVAALADADLLAQWETHLLPLVQAGQITCWSERHLHVGADRLVQVLEHLAQAQGVVLLLSADFFASDECMACMEHVLWCHQTKSSVVIPLLLRPVVWQELALGSFQSLPASGLPVIQWSSRDEAFHACVQELRALLHLAPIPAPEEALYREHVVKAYNWLNFAGFGQGDLTLASVSLEDIFVRLRLTVELVSREPESHHEKHTSDYGDTGPDVSIIVVDVDTFLHGTLNNMPKKCPHNNEWPLKRDPQSLKNASEKRTAPRQQARVMRVQEPIALVDALKTNLLVVGEPGAGKSILLRWLAVTFAQRRQGEPARLGPLAEPDRLPIVVELGQLPAPYLLAEGGKRPNWLQLLPTLLSGQQSFPGISSHFVTQAFQAGQCLLLFDRLDEIAHGQARLRIAQSIAELVRLFPQCQRLRTFAPR